MGKRKNKRRDPHADSSNTSSDNETMSVKRAKLVEEEVALENIREAATEEEIVGHSGVGKLKLEKRMRELESTVQRMQEELDDMCGNVFEQKCDNDRLTREIHFLKKERETLRNELQDARTVIGKNRAQLNHLEQWTRRWNVMI